MMSAFAKQHISSSAFLPLLHTAGAYLRYYRLYYAVIFLRFMCSAPTNIPGRQSYGTPSERLHNVVRRYVRLRALNSRQYLTPKPRLFVLYLFSERFRVSATFSGRNTIVYFRAACLALPSAWLRTPKMHKPLLFIEEEAISTR